MAVDGIYDRVVDHDDTWDSYAAGWDQDEGARAYASAAFSSLEGVLSGAGVELDGARVLDFGCGTGLLTERLVASGASVHAVDTSPAMLAVLEDKIQGRGWVGVTTGDRPAADGPVIDLVVCSSVCSFLDDYPATVAELVALLRAGGVFIQWDWERGDGDDHGLSRAEIGEALGGAGLVSTTVETGFVVTIEGETMRPLVGHGRRPGAGSDLS